MTVYTNNIPQAGDDPSNSQDQILQNFQTLNTIYGTSGDHYAWTDTNSTELAKHAKVTMPGLPTSSAPGNALPTPLSGNCAIFSQTVNSQTTPYVVRDGLSPTAPLTNIWPLLPIKAYATWTLTNGITGSLLDSFNISSLSVNTVNSSYFVTTFTITNAMKSANYGVLLSTTFFKTPANFSNFVLTYAVINTTSFTATVQVPAPSQPISTFFPFNMTALVIQS